MIPDLHKPQNSAIRQMYNVEIYKDKDIMTIITVRAKDHEEASAKAREQFFKGINVKIKRAYN